jgi:hypothetical protein
MPNATSAAPPRVVLDWRKGQVSDQPAPCVLCGLPALCRSPVKDVPCHKGCAEAWITANARDAGHLAWVIAAYTPKGAAA